MRQINSIEQLALEEMVFNATGKKTSGIFRTFLASQNFLSAVIGSVGKTLFFGTLDVSYLGDNWNDTVGKFLAFKLGDQIVRVADNATDNDTPILFDRIEVISSTGATQSIVTVSWQESWSDEDYYLFDTDLSAAGNVALWRSNTAYTVSEAINANAPGGVFSIASPVDLLSTENLVAGNLLVRKTDSSVQRWLYPSADAAKRVLAGDVCVLSGMSKLLRFGSVTAKLLPLEYVAGSSSFAKISGNEVKYYNGAKGFNLEKPDDVGFTDALYQVSVNKVNGSVRMRSKKVSDSTYTAHLDEIAPLEGGVFELPVPVALLNDVEAQKIEFSYIPPVAPPTGYHYYAAREYECVNYDFGAQITVAFTAQVGVIGKYYQQTGVSNPDFVYKLNNYLGTSDPGGAVPIMNASTGSDTAELACNIS